RDAVRAGLRLVEKSDPHLGPRRRAGGGQIVTPAPVVFLVDVDNTLLDNDRIQDDLKRHLEREYRDYLGALQRYRVEHLKDVHLMSMSSYLVDYPFANRLYSGALDVIERLRTLG